MGEVVVEKLGGEKFEVYWPYIERELETVPHTWAPWWTKESFYHFTQAGLFHCWAAGTPEKIEVILFAQVLQYPASRVLHVVTTFGRNFALYRDVLEAVLEKFANDEQCTWAEITGRPGWGPQLVDLGFVRTTVTWTKRLPHVRMN